MRDAFCFGALLLLPAIAMAADVGAVQVTFAKDVAPIFQEKCQECHRKGTAAPMSLVTFEETRPWAKSVRQRVITRNMPPWHLDKTVGIQEFQNDRSLSESQIATIVRWVDSGAPLGNPQDMPQNLKQELEIPAGTNNRIEPGGPDQSQPTHFLAGRQWGVFTIRVPRDFGDRKLTWTLTAQ